MKIFEKITATIMAICLSFGFAMMSFTFAAFNPNFYERQAKKNDSLAVLEINQADFDKVVDQLILYFGRKSDTLQLQITQGGEVVDFYTADELSHMEDVKKMFNAVITISIILLALGILIFALIFFLNRKRAVKTFAFGFLTGNFIILAIGLILGIAVLIDFENVFHLFHETFFPQGNYSFPSSSNMIKLMPESFFMDASLIILASGIAFVAVSLVAGFFLKNACKNN